MSDRKFCRNWVLLSERCRRLQYSLEKQSQLIPTDRHRGENRRAKRDGGHLGARNTWPADSKELGSNDCISESQTQTVMLVTV